MKNNLMGVLALLLALGLVITAISDNSVYNIAILIVACVITSICYMQYKKGKSPIKDVRGFSFLLIATIIHIFRDFLKPGTPLDIFRIALWLVFLVLGMYNIHKKEQFG